MRRYFVEVKAKFDLTDLSDSVRQTHKEDFILEAQLNVGQNTVYSETYVSKPKRRHGVLFEKLQTRWEGKRA